jgi:protocatechuate 3,4-dioxygenase beta subunit
VLIRTRSLALPSRRSLLLAVPALPALAQLKQTPMQTLGPFYPADRPMDADADLTRIKGKPGTAKGDILYVAGRVLNRKGEPIRGARVEVWQANANGRYRHPGDNSGLALDDNFEGFAELRTDAEGRYQFKTIKPAAYPAGRNLRPPHIHFDVTGKYTRLTTQMYFPGEPLNEKDQIFRESGASRELLIAKILPPGKDQEPESKVAIWDLVLSNG